MTTSRDPISTGSHDQSDAMNVGTERSLPDPLPPEPFGLFKQWFDEAWAKRLQPNANAMTLATIDPDGRPSARIVLCKHIDVDSGHIVFHTHYQGRKGRALAANPRASVVFHWDAFDRQVRIEGPVVKSPKSESDAYFQTRAWISRVGAWTSNQSQPVASRAALVEHLYDVYRRFGIDPANPPPADAKIDIPRPPEWGGFRVHAERVELWVGGVGRLHDRAEWTRTLGPAPASPDHGSGHSPAWVALTPWRSTRLQP